MKVAIITDQHFGARNDDNRFADFFEKFYSKQFFPYLAKHNINTVLDLGDTFDRRKYVNFNTLSRTKKMWLEPLAKNNITLHSVVGNHTSFYKNTNRINTVDLLFNKYSNIHVYEQASEIILDGLKIILVPWINSTNTKHTFDLIESTDATVLMGHLEVKGFRMYKTSVNQEHGYEIEAFRKFDVVCSGHYHHKSTQYNVHYLGAPYEMTWHDFEDDRGFHIFDTETKQLEYIVNKFTIFNKIHYNDQQGNIEQWIEQFDFKKYKDTFVKVIVQSKNQPFMFDKFIARLEKQNLVSLQIVDDHLNLSFEDDDDIIEQAEDTLKILQNYVRQTDTGVDSTKLLNFIEQLYYEASHV